MDEPRQLLLSPRRMGSGGVPGATIVTADCGHQSWISPAGLQVMLTEKMRSVCADCAPISDEELQVSLHPLVREELAGMLGEAEADAISAEAVRRPADVIRANRGRHRRR